MLNNWRIQTLGRFLNLTLVITLIITVGAGSLTFLKMKELNHTWIEFSENAVVKSNILSDIRGSLGYGGMIHHYNKFLIEQQEEDLNKLKNDIQALYRNVEGYRELGTTEGEENALKTLTEKVSEYEKNLDWISKSVSEYGMAAAEISADISYDNSAMLNAINTLGTYISTLENKIHMDMTEANRTVTFLISISVILTTLLLLLPIIGIFWFTRVRLEAPLSKIESFMETLGDGDYRERMPVETEDELGSVQKACNSFTESTAKLIRGIQTVTHEVHGAVREITSRSQHLLDAFRKQQTTLEEIQAAVSDTSSHVLEINTEAERTAQEAVTINADATNANEVMAQLANDSEEITQVLQVIRDISDQTNLLALNAAIEAARAGDAGQGFAVVADEVRKLAQHTGQSTDKIEEVVNKLQRNVEDSQNAIERINTSVETINTQSKVVSDATQRQASALEEITSSVSEFSSQMNTSMEAVEDVISHSQSVDESSNSMDESVNKFKV